MLFGLLLLGFAGVACASCVRVSRGARSVARFGFEPPAQILLPENAAVGTVLWTSPPVMATNVPILQCSGSTDGGILNRTGNQPAEDADTLYPIGNSGLSYRLLYPDASNPLPAWPDETIAGGTALFDQPVALQLVVTGAVRTPRSLGGTLARWRVTGAGFVARFATTRFRIDAPACKEPGVLVILPAVFTSSFDGVGSSAGRTPFDVHFQCRAGTAPLQIVLSTGNPEAGANGVVAPMPGSGYAENVGVQILGSRGTPIQFGRGMPAGASATGKFDMAFFARYYQIGSPVTAGRVHATATYTLTYR